MDCVAIDSFLLIPIVCLVSLMQSKSKCVHESALCMTDMQGYRPNLNEECSLQHTTRSLFCNIMKLNLQHHQHHHSIPSEESSAVHSISEEC